jgi:hypothetical protein
MPDKASGISSENLPNEAETVTMNTAEIQATDAEQEAQLLKDLEEAMREADDPATVMIPHEEVMRELNELRKEWRAQAEKERTAA